METVLTDPLALQGLVAGLSAVLALVATYALGQRSAMRALAAAQAAAPAVVSSAPSIPLTEPASAAEFELAPAAATSTAGCVAPPPAEFMAAGEVSPSAAAGGLAADGEVRRVRGHAVRADGTVVHLRMMSDVQAVEAFVAWLRDEADRPADSNAYEDIWARVALVSWMRPNDLYGLYRAWCREHYVMPDNQPGFMSNVQCVPGVDYGRHRLRGPAFQHLLDQTQITRAWVVRVAPNEEMTAKGRRSAPGTRARGGGARAAAGKTVGAVDHGVAHLARLRELAADHDGQHSAHRVARAA